MGCMNPLPEGRAECGICGYPANGENPSLYLPVGTVLSERYLVGRVLEVGGDGAVYIGYDKVLNPLSSFANSSPTPSAAGRKTVRP